MNKDSKVIAIVALCIGVVGLSLGFAAFSAQLTVSSGATVTVDEDTNFKDVFGFMADTQKDTTLNEKTDAAGAIAENYAKAWTGITYNFTTTGETRVYTATVKNDSALVAYLDEVSEPAQASCDTPGDGTITASADLKAKACGEITLDVDAPASIPAGGEGTVTVTITGPSTPVDGDLKVVFSDVLIDYTTTNPNPVQG